MSFSDVPDKEGVTKEYLSNMLNNISPLLKGILLKLVKQYLPSNVVDRFHEFEMLFNKFMNVYHSNLSKEEKIKKLKDISEFSELTTDDTTKLFEDLDGIMNRMGKNVSFHTKLSGDKVEKNTQDKDNTQENNNVDLQSMDSLDSMPNLLTNMVESLKNTTNITDMTNKNKENKENKDNKDVKSVVINNLSNVFKRLAEEYNPTTHESEPELDLNSDIGKFLLRTPSNKDVTLDSDEAYELIQSYAQKCIDYHNNYHNNNHMQKGGADKEDSTDETADKTGDETGDETDDNTAPVLSTNISPLLNESNESLNKQRGFMENIDDIRDNEEIDETTYMPAEIGGVGRDLKNDKVLYRFQYDILNKKMNILTRMLIALSAVPVFGWFFDVLLIVYAIFTKNYKLAIYTIVGTLSVIGREFSKALYLLDESQQMKKTLTNPSYARFNVASKDSSLVKKTTPEIINGEYVLVDEDGNIYSPIISKQEKIGQLSKDKSRVHFFDSPPPSPYSNANKNIIKEAATARTSFIDKFRKILKENNIDTKHPQESLQDPQDPQSN
jgi:hypothetical protein